MYFIIPEVLFGHGELAKFFGGRLSSSRQNSITMHLSLRLGGKTPFRYYKCGAYLIFLVNMKFLSVVLGRDGQGTLKICVKTVQWYYLIQESSTGHAQKA